MKPDSGRGDFFPSQAQGLLQGLGLPEAGIVCLCGAGGKTTLMYALAAQAAASGRAVVCSTTTKVFVPRIPEDVYALFLGKEQQNSLSEILRRPPSAWPVFLAARRLPGAQPSEEKLQGLLPETLDALHREFPEYLFLVEADGAARKALKAPAEHEPVFPALTRLAVAVVGLEAVTGQLDPVLVHRAERVSALTGVPMGHNLSVAAMQVLADHEEGWFRGGPGSSKKIVFGNKADIFAVPEGWPWPYGSAAQGWCV